MLRTAFLPRTLSIALLALAGASRVSATYESNAIGLANAFYDVVIINGDCTTLDAKSLGDRTLCGTYKNGSEVICNDQTTPVTIHTADGKSWGNCFDGKGEYCGPEGVTDLPVVSWWCTAI